MRLFLATIHGELAALSIYPVLQNWDFPALFRQRVVNKEVACCIVELKWCVFFYSSIGAISHAVFIGFLTNKKADKTGIAFV